MSLTALDTIYRAPGPDRVRRLNAGINAAVFAALAATINVPVSTLAVSLGLSPRTLRNRSGRLTADETERSFRVYRVLRRATEVLGDAASAKAWMSTAQISLGEKTPLSLLVRDVGTEDVLNVLGAIEDGGYL